ncbi:MAG TPA: hypothetical protein VHH34_09815, partial [Pseudonocardiaceae bacterium]|nr:hypothetical protein [Pseudonocardiaceae bacterium]
MALQRQAGNRAVSRLVAQRRAATPKPATVTPKSGTAPGKPGTFMATGPGGTTSPAVPATPVVWGRDSPVGPSAPVQRLAEGTRPGPGADPKFA